VFTYSNEEGTAAASLGAQVPERVKHARRARVMETQARVAARRAAAQVGTIVETLVEGRHGRRLVGRTRTQAPEIDGVIELDGDAAPGDLVRARVVEARIYDLRARVVPDSSKVIDRPPVGA